MDALPGKTFSVEAIALVVRLRLDGAPARVAAKAVGARGKSVGLWLIGLGRRVLGLVKLFRHRAIIAPSQAIGPAILCAWSAVVVALRSAGAAFVVEPGSDEKSALRVLLNFIDRLGGVISTVELGASAFHQAILLFRTTKAPTSSDRRSRADRGWC